MKPTIQKKPSDDDTIAAKARLVNPHPKGSPQARAWSLRVVREAREAGKYEEMFDNMPKDDRKKWVEGSWDVEEKGAGNG